LTLDHDLIAAQKEMEEISLGLGKKSEANSDSNHRMDILKESDVADAYNGGPGGDRLASDLALRQIKTYSSATCGDSGNNTSSSSSRNGHFSSIFKRAVNHNNDNNVINSRSAPSSPAVRRNRAYTVGSSSPKTLEALLRKASRRLVSESSSSNVTNDNKNNSDNNSSTTGSTTNLNGTTVITSNVSSPTRHRRGTKGGFKSATKPRNIHFTFNSNTTSTKSPDEVMKEIQKTLKFKFIDFEYVDTYYILCTHMDNEKKPTQWEMEVCRIALLNMSGVRFKRIGGSSVTYKNIVHSVLASMKL